MSSAVTSPSEHEVEVAGLRIRSMRGGSGVPLLLLHRSTGNTGWSEFHECLSTNFEVDVPDLPGYGQSTLPEWAREPRDLAILMLQYLRKRDLRAASVVGLGFGGFIAAHMATMDAESVGRLVLVGSPGLRPEEGEIMDQMLIEHAAYVKAGFRDEETATRHLGEEIDPNLLALWQFNRVMTARIAWKPYMFDPRLPALLPEVRTPTLLVYGGADRVIPPAIPARYASTLPNARLELIPEAGHLVEVEEPEVVAGLVHAHALQSQPTSTRT
ncbi:MAG: alpha/beta fold hydrolase [Dehalococcoidia bacterium]|nr:alpha/beta fold hydrolase [Dehalococcoidia bacterium]